MRWLLTPVLIVASFLLLAMTDAVGVTSGDRVWLFGASLGVMFWAGLDFGVVLARKVRDGR